MGRPCHGCPCGQPSSSTSNDAAPEAEGSGFLSTTTPTSQSGSVSQSQSIFTFATSVRTQLETRRLASSGTRSELERWRRAGRRKTSSAPRPSNVKSTRSATTTPRAASKHAYVPGASSRRLAFTARQCARARLSAAPLWRFIVEKPKAAAFTHGPPWGRGRSISNVPAPWGMRTGRASPPWLSVTGRSAAPPAESAQSESAQTIPHATRIIGRSPARRACRTCRASVRPPRGRRAAHPPQTPRGSARGA